MSVKKQYSTQTITTSPISTKMIVWANLQFWAYFHLVAYWHYCSLPRLSSGVRALQMNVCFIFRWWYRRGPSHSGWPYSQAREISEIWYSNLINLHSIFDLPQKFLMSNPFVIWLTVWLELLLSLCWLKPITASGGVNYLGPIDVVRKTLRTEGPLAFYKGLSATFLRLWPHTVLLWLAQEAISKQLRSGFWDLQDKHQKGWKDSLASIVASLRQSVYTSSPRRWQRSYYILLVLFITIFGLFLCPF